MSSSAKWETFSNGKYLPPRSSLWRSVCTFPKWLSSLPNYIRDYYPVRFWVKLSAVEIFVMPSAETGAGVGRDWSTVYRRPLLGELHNPLLHHLHYQHQDHLHLIHQDHLRGGEVADRESRWRSGRDFIEKLRIKLVNWLTEDWVRGPVMRCDLNMILPTVSALSGPFLPSFWLVCTLSYLLRQYLY